MTLNPTPQQTRQAFAALARQHDDALMRLALRLLNNNHDRAADLVQDTLMRAYQAMLAGRFDANQDARAWLRRIATNLFINEYHRRKKWDADIDLDTLTASGEVGPPGTRAAEDDMPGVTLMKNLLDEELEIALAQLSEGLRLCVILVDMEGLDYAEAAKTLGIPIGTVRSRLSRARMQLQDLLRDFGRRRGLI